MAKEAGLYTKCEVHSAVPFDQLLTSFAALIAAAEREACTKEIEVEICDEIEDEAYCILVALLARIRARGKE
jgi:hypothetical protein